jgi:HemK-related putative methylase
MPDRPRLAVLRDLDRVYEPAEDSRLLAATAIKRIDPGDRVLDVGTGTGYVGTRITVETGAAVVGVDIDRAACRRAREVGLGVVRGDLCTPFAESAFDVVVCNPPYLPARKDGWDDAMARAIAAGPEGRAVIDRLLRTVGRVLAPGGRLFVLLSTVTGPEAVRETAREVGLAVTQISAESYPFERLLVFEVRPTQPE